MSTTFKDGTKVRFTTKGGETVVARVERQIDQPNGKFYEVEHLDAVGKRTGVISRRRPAVLTKV